MGTVRPNRARQDGQKAGWRAMWRDHEGGSTQRRRRHRQYPAATCTAYADTVDSMISRYYDVMPKQTTVRLPDELADEAEAVARVQGTSVNQLIIDSLTNEIKRVRADDDFTSRAKRLIERDKELLERLAR